MEQEHTGTVIYWRLAGGGLLSSQWMKITDEERAVEVALREGYLPKDAEIVATEPAFTSYLQACYDSCYDTRRISALRHWGVAVEVAE